ncbi:MAG: hypothetical protein E7057_09185 [Lentisphaerae bacterium]|nr:hypothetical protein [Lentisphaerota bacterium]
MRGFRKIISIFFAAGILSCTFRVSGDVTLAPGLLLRTDYSGHETSYLKSIIRQLDRYAREAGIKAASKEITIICGDGKYFGYFAKNRLYLPGTAPRWQYDFAFRSKLYAALAAHRFNFTLPDNSNGVAPWITKALDAELDAAASSGQYLFANRSFPMLYEFAGYYGTLPDFAAMCRLGGTDDPLLSAFIAEQGRILLRLLARDGKIKEVFENSTQGGEPDFFVTFHASADAAVEYYTKAAERLIWNQYRPMPGALAKIKLAELDIIFVQQLDNDGKPTGDYQECNWQQLAVILRKKRPDAYRLRGKLAAAYQNFGKFLTVEENRLCADVSAAARELGKNDRSDAAFDRALTTLKNAIDRRIKIDRFFRDTLLLNTPLPDKFPHLFEASLPRNRVMNDAERSFLIKTLNNYLQ